MFHWCLRQLSCATETCGIIKVLLVYVLTLLLCCPLTFVAAPLDTTRFLKYAQTHTTALVNFMAAGHDRMQQISWPGRGQRVHVAWIKQQSPGITTNVNDTTQPMHLMHGCFILLSAVDHVCVEAWVIRVGWDCFCIPVIASCVVGDS